MLMYVISVQAPSKILGDVIEIDCIVSCVACGMRVYFGLCVYMCICVHVLSVTVFVLWMIVKY